MVFSSPEAKVGPLPGSSQTTWCRCRSQTLGVRSLPLFLISCMLGWNRVTYPSASEPGSNVEARPGPLTFFACGQVFVMANRLRFCPGEIGRGSVRHLYVLMSG